MVLILVISGFGSAEFQIPHIFTEKGLFKPRGQSVAGIDLVDFIIGTFFLIGGLLVIASILFGNNRQPITHDFHLLLQKLFALHDHARYE